MRFLLLFEEFFPKSKPIIKKDWKKIKDGELSEEEKEEVELLFKNQNAGYEDKRIIADAKLRSL